MTTPVDDISDLARRFAGEYLLDFKVNKAASRAGCTTGQGQAFLDDPRVQSIINDQKRRASDRVNIGVDYVLEKYRRIIEGSPIDYFREGSGRGLKPYNELTDEERDALKSIKFTMNGPAVETHDKVGALKAVGQFLGMFVEKVEHSGVVETKRTALSEAEIIAELEARGLPTQLFDQAPTTGEADT